MIGAHTHGTLSCLCHPCTKKALQLCGSCNLALLCDINDTSGSYEMWHTIDVQALLPRSCLGVTLTVVVPLAFRMWMLLRRTK